MKKYLLGFLFLFVMLLCSVGCIYAKDAKKIALNKTNVVEHAQNHVYLKAKNVAKKAKVKWSTSNKKYATVDGNGSIWLLKPGKVTVTAIYKNQKATCKITIKKALEISNKQIYVNVGKSKQLKISNMFKNEKVKWTSLDPVVARVDAKGYVQGKAKGSTAIHAQIGQCIINCDVTVLTPIGMNVGGNMNMVTGDVSQLRIERDTTNQKVKWNWSSSNGQVVSVDQNGVVNAINEGTAVITATKDGETISTTMTVSDPAIKFNLVGNGIQAYVKNAQQPVTWTTSDPNVATIDENGNVTAHNKGQLTITGTIGDQSATYDLYVSQSNFNHTTTYLFWRTSNNRIVTINKVKATMKNYYTCDDYINYKTCYKKFNDQNPNKLDLQSVYRIQGMILKANYSYQFMIAREENAYDQSAVGLSAGDTIRLDRLTTMKHTSIPKAYFGANASAHRGDMTKAPENTTAAFIAAGKNKKYFSIESDLHDTKDGHFVMIHDNYLKRMTNIGANNPHAMTPLSQLTLSEIRSYKIKYKMKKKMKVYNLRIPTFEEYLDICKKYNKYAQIDIKTLNHTGSIQRMIDMIYAKGMQNRVIIMGLKVGYLENIAHTARGAALRKNALFYDVLEPNVKQMILESGVGAVSINYQHMTNADRKWCAKYKIQYGKW